MDKSLRKGTLLGKGALFGSARRALYLQELSTTEHSVLTYLIDKSSSESLDCWPSIKNIAAWCGIRDDKYAGKILRSLERKGFIKIYKRKVSRNNNGYIINLERLQALSEAEPRKTQLPPDREPQKPDEAPVKQSQEAPFEKPKEPPPRKPDKPKSPNLTINESHETKIPHRAAIELKVVENNLSPAEILANMKKLTNSMRRNL